MLDRWSVPIFRGPTSTILDDGCVNLAASQIATEVPILPAFLAHFLCFAFNCPWILLGHQTYHLSTNQVRYQSKIIHRGKYFALFKVNYESKSRTQQHPYVNGFAWPHWIPNIVFLWTGSKESNMHMTPHFCPSTKFSQITYAILKPQEMTKRY